MGIPGGIPGAIPGAGASLGDPLLELRPPPSQQATETDGLRHSAPVIEAIDGLGRAGQQDRDIGGGEHEGRISAIAALRHGRAFSAFTDSSHQGESFHN